MGKSIEENALESIKILVNKALNSASFNRTITGIIQSCEDSTIGKYKVQYQDSSIYAYASSPEITYLKGAMVYINVPNNDLSENKIILGEVEKLGINYTHSLSQEEQFEILGKNILNQLRTVELCSYQGEQTLELYGKKSAYIDISGIDKQNIKDYIKSSESKNFICKARMQTKLNAEQKESGRYGLRFLLKFKNEENEQNYIYREYEFGIDNIIGDPYNLIVPIQQSAIFQLDVDNFEGIESITAFCEDFPNTNKEISTNDIFISDIEFCAANKIPDETLKDNCIIFITPDGTIFRDSTKPQDSLRLQAQIRINGQVVNNSSQKIQYYWFTEDLSVNASKKEYYNAHGGQGWRCLNEYVKSYYDKSKTSYEINWTPAANEYVVRADKIFAKEAKYKCVAVFNNTDNTSTRISQTIVIKKDFNSKSISIISDLGTQFYFDGGKYPTLTCKVDGREDTTNYTYKWAKIDENNATSFITSAGSAQKYTEVTKKIEELEKQNKPKKTIEEEIKAYKEKEKIADSFLQYTTIIDKNKLIHFNINGISNFITIGCSVYNKDGQLIGTAKISLKNGYAPEGTYFLAINNADKVFKYNAQGTAPTVDKNVNMVLDALTYTIYDNVGNPLSEELIKNKVKTTWYAPKNTKPSTETDKEGNTIYNNNSDSMLVIKNNKSSSTNQYDIYTDAQLDYQIVSKFDFNRNNNNIILEVEYKGVKLKAATNFTFVKDGESGTNGTDMVLKIEPNSSTQDNHAKQNGILPMLYIHKSGKIESNFTKYPNAIRFKAVLYQNGYALDDFSQSSVTWSVKRNKYKNNLDSTYFSINQTSGVVSSTLNRELQITEEKGFLYNKSYAAIIQATCNYNGKTYIANYPLVACFVDETNLSYHVGIKEGTGYQSVLYDSDGTNPKFNKKQFEFKVFDSDWNEITDDKYYKITSSVLGPSSSVPTSSGNVLDKDNTGWKYKVTDNKFTNYTKGQLPEPAAKYNGYCVTNGIKCQIKVQDKVFNIFVPVDFTLNTYGMSNINGWDGNSLEINNDGAYILTPQIGAGKKDNNNKFTGMVMGVVQNGTQTKTGLVGYSKGEESIFLDSGSGSATFGLATKGQIKIDTSSSNQQAMIISGDFKSGTNGKGMRIIFSSSGSSNTNGGPRIEFGSGKFIVNKEGEITSTSGTIGGWKIGKDTLSARGKDGTISLSTDTEGYAINANNKFLVDFNGKLIARDAEIKGDINARTGHIGGDSGWTIDTGKMYTGKKDDFNNASYGVYLGTKGIRLGDKFQVDPYGNILAISLTVDNIGNFNDRVKNIFADQISSIKINTSTINATTGSIGGWDINSDSISRNGLSLNGNGTISGNNWSINSSSGLTISGSGGSESRPNGFDFNTGKLFLAGHTMTNQETLIFDPSEEEGKGLVVSKITMDVTNSGIYIIDGTTNTKYHGISKTVNGIKFIHGIAVDG